MTIQPRLLWCYPLIVVLLLGAGVSHGEEPIDQPVASVAESEDSPPAASEASDTEPEPEPEVVTTPEPDQPAAAEPESVRAGVLEVKWNEMIARKRVKPVVPPYANLPRPIQCKIRFTVDETGLPARVDILKCPDKLRLNAKKAAERWRFEPLMVDGVARKARFTIVLKITH